MQPPLTPSPPEELSSNPQPTYDTTLIRAAATLLICNSHLEAFYKWPWLAADGLLGNSLFFLLSGFGLTLSQGRTQRGFAEWAWRRLQRLYPALWISTAVACLLGGAYRSWKPWDYVTTFIYPTPYGYISTILLLYVPLYFLLRARKPQLYLLTLLGVMLPYFILYWLDLRGVPANAPLSLGTRSRWVWDLFDFQPVLLGCWLASRPKRLESRPAVDWSLLVILFALYVGLKLYMVRGHFAHFYFLLNWLTLGILYYGFRVGTSPAMVKLYRSRRFLSTPLTLLASLTLELYLTHFYVAENRRIEALPFPVNIAAFFALSLLLAWALGWVVNRLQPSRRTPGGANTNPVR